MHVIGLKSPLKMALIKCGYHAWVFEYSSFIKAFINARINTPKITNGGKAEAETHREHYHNNTIILLSAPIHHQVCLYHMCTLYTETWIVVIALVGWKIVCVLWSPGTRLLYLPYIGRIWRIFHQNYFFLNMS